MIDHPLVRTVLGVLVGFPLSLVTLFAAPYGLLLGYGGVAEGNPQLFFLGLMTVLGLIAIYGAWYRLLVPHAEMVAAQVRRIRFCLYCGVISSLGLAGSVISSLNLAGCASCESQYQYIILSGALGLLAIVGVVLIHSTPIRNAL
jgi:hypothetical protein